MTNIEFKTIQSQIPNLKNLPNNILVSYMDFLTKDFEETKQKLLELTYQLDTIEEYYNTIMKEYEKRVNE